MKSLLKHTLIQISDLCEVQRAQQYARAQSLREAAPAHSTADEAENHGYEIGHADGENGAYTDIKRRIDALVKALDE